MSENKIADGNDGGNNTEVFMRAAERLILGDTPHPEATPTQRVGLQLASYLAAVFRAPIDAESERWLAKCQELFEAEPTITLRRERAILAVKACGAAMGELRETALATLRWNLAAADPAFRAAYEGAIGLEIIESRMADYSANPRLKGGASAPKVLATMIVLDTEDGALGFDAAGDEDERIERIRQDLASSKPKRSKRTKPKRAKKKKTA